MKTFLKILGGIVALFLILVVALHFYFTDARLKEMVVPRLDEALGRTVSVEHLSFSLLTTFPNVGLDVEGVAIPGDQPQDTLISLKQLTVKVELIPLISKNIRIAGLSLDEPRFVYHVYKNGKTNLDGLMKALQSGSTDTSSTSLPLNINDFSLRNGQFGYIDDSSQMNIGLRDVDASANINYGKVLNTDLTLSLGGVDFSKGGSNYLNGLAVKLEESSEVDLDIEQVSLKSGKLTIQGLNLDLKGNISQWSKTPQVDLQFASSSSDFGALLKLLPADMQSKFKNYETKGSLTLNGSVEGAVEGSKLPAINAKLDVANGYLKDPDLQEPVKDITLNAVFTNDKLTVSSLHASAGSNVIQGSGSLTKPLEDNGRFQANLKGDVDLGTVEQFYSLKSMDVDAMKGKLHLDAKANGSRKDPSKADINAHIDLQNGYLKYAKAQKPFENINLIADASQNEIKIQRLQAQAAGNSLDASGTVTSYMDSTRRAVDMNVKLDADLSTIPQFYPINPDTMQMKGKLSVNARISGKTAKPESMSGNGHVSLTNGYIKYVDFPAPIEDITLAADISNNTINIQKGSLRTGSDQLAMSGSIKNYLSDSPVVDLSINSKTHLDELETYYSLKPMITRMTGISTANLKVRGPVSTPEKLELSGNLELQNVNIEGDSLPEPVRNLNARMTLTPTEAKLDSYKMFLGPSDIQIDGSMRNYMTMLEDEPHKMPPADLSGSFTSRHFNFDKLIAWEEKHSDPNDTTPVPINLPYMKSSLNVNVDTLTATGVNMTKMKANITTSQKDIRMTKGQFDLFGGQVSGMFVWDVPKPLKTNITFKGTMDSVRVDQFFKEYPVLGKNSKFYKYVNGKFSATADYNTDMFPYLSPVMKSTKANGTFGMHNAKLQGHPVQKELAKLLKAPELERATLDDWTATYKIDNGVLTLNNVKLTSQDIGVEMNGTQNLINDKLDFKMTLLLPGRFGDRLGSLIGSKTMDLLRTDKGTVAVPLLITGTSEQPKVTVDKDAVKKMVEEAAKNALKNKLKGIFGGGNKN